MNRSAQRIGDAWAEVARQEALEQQRARRNAAAPGAPTAETLNEHLAAGGRVQVTTYGRSTIYQKRHAGMFSQGKDGNLYVASGRSKDCLTMAGGTKVLVGIRLIK